jgi:hypothetical protein
MKAVGIAELASQTPGQRFADRRLAGTCHAHHDDRRDPRLRAHPLLPGS